MFSLQEVEEKLKGKKFTIPSVSLLADIDGKHSRSVSAPGFYHIFPLADLEGKGEKFFSPWEKKRVMNEVRSRCRWEAEKGLLHFPNSPFAKVYAAGWGVAPTVEELEKKAKKYIPSSGRNFILGKLVPRDVNGNIRESAALSCHQVASQFNALEMLNPHMDPVDGVAIYEKDATQGPAAALTCAPGTLVRNYFTPEMLEGQFNALGDIGIHPANGYLIWGDDPQTLLEFITDSDFERGNKSAEQMMWGKYPTLKLTRIPCQIFTQVCGVRVGEEEKREIFSQRKLVHQVFSSAAPFDYYGNGGDEAAQKEIIFALLYYQYVGFFTAAAVFHVLGIEAGLILPEEDGKYPFAHVYVTLLGVGAFNVPLEVTLSALSLALNHCKDYPLFYMFSFSEEDHEDFKETLSTLVPELEYREF